VSGYKAGVSGAKHNQLIDQYHQYCYNIACMAGGSFPGLPDFRDYNTACYQQAYRKLREIVDLKNSSKTSKKNSKFRLYFSGTCTRKNAQVATNLQQICSNAVSTPCQQDVFAKLVPSLLRSCQRLVNNLLQGC
jgi:hypothetical protein